MIPEVRENAEPRAISRALNMRTFYSPNTLCVHDETQRIIQLSPETHMPDENYAALVSYDREMKQSQGMG